MALFWSVQEGDDLYQRLEEEPQCLEEDILMRVIVTLMTIDHVMDEDILEGEDITLKEIPSKKHFEFKSQ